MTRRYQQSGRHLNATPTILDRMSAFLFGLLACSMIVPISAKAQSHEWVKSAPQHDDLNGTSSISYSLSSETGDGRTGAQLVFYCSNGKLFENPRVFTDAIIHKRYLNQWIGLVTDVGVRLDSKKFPVRSFLVADDFRSFRLSNSWLKDILKHQEFVVSYEVSPGIMTVSLFKITHAGLTDAQQQCGQLP